MYLHYGGLFFGIYDRGYSHTWPGKLQQEWPWRSFSYENVYEDDDYDPWRWLYGVVGGSLSAYPFQTVYVRYLHDKMRS